MRIVVLFVAVLLMAVGVVGMIAPDTLTEVRRTYVATPFGLYAMGAVRVVIGCLLILSASTSRTPKTLRALGVLVCLQGLVQGVGAPFVGIDRARTILEWEGAHRGLLRAGALIALATGSFVAFTVTSRPARSDSGRAPVLR
jgi:sugar phosphate permease